MMQNEHTKRVRALLDPRIEGGHMNMVDENGNEIDDLDIESLFGFGVTVNIESQHIDFTIVTGKTIQKQNSETQTWETQTYSPVEYAETVAAALKKAHPDENYRILNADGTKVEVDGL